METARGKEAIKDFSENGVPLKKFDKNEKLYEFLLNNKANNNKYATEKTIESWKNLENITDAEKVELYIRQDGIDLLTGEKIDITRLYDYQVDHILPRGFGDNSLENKQLIHKNANQKKVIVYL